MKVVILGAGGMLGHTLLRSLARRFDLSGTVRAAQAPPALAGHRVLTGVEAGDLAALERALDTTRAAAVVNCIGLIKQLQPGRRELIELNALFPHQLLDLCRPRGIRVIHLSTDCVFSGSTGGYSETSLPDPVDDYGRSKLLGELDAPALTLRTSIIGRELTGRHGLVEWFYSRRGLPARGFRQAIYSGLTTLELARVIADILEHHGDLSGIWHVSGKPIDKHDLLDRLNRRARLGIELSADDDFRCDRSLDSGRFQERTGYRPPDWDEMLEELVREGEGYDAPG